MTGQYRHDLEFDAKTVLSTSPMLAFIFALVWALALTLALTLAFPEAILDLLRLRQCICHLGHDLGDWSRLINKGYTSPQRLHHMSQLQTRHARLNSKVSG